MFYGDFERIEEIELAFEAPGALDGCTVLYAEYDTETHSYEGYGYVLFQKDGQLFEVEGSHCSCYGLEEQWDPSPITAAELRDYLAKHKQRAFAAGDREDILAALERAGY